MGETQNFKTEAVLSSSLRLHQWEMYVFFSLQMSSQVMHCLTADKSDVLLTFSAPANQIK